jgi:alpha-amylase
MIRRTATLLAAAIPNVASAQPDYRDEILYQIMPIAWRDSNNDTNRYGDFGGLTASLDYLQQLGVTALYINPIFPSAAYHGYQHGDASQLNAWFGTQTEFLNFVNQAHTRGMKVILDFVAYGISQNSIWYQGAFNNPASTYDQWLAFTNAANTSFTGYSFTTWSGASVGFIHWNLDNVNARNLQSTWARKWMDPNSDGIFTDGVDGYRLDHAYSSAPEGWGATIGFWQSWASSLRALNPNVFVFCEPGDWGNYGTDLLTPTGFDAVVTKPFEFAARDALVNQTSASLYSSIAATTAAIPAGKTVIAEINDHDSDRIASILGNSNPRAKVAAAVLLTQPFPPNIYYGDEIAMRGTKGNFGSDANDIPMREPFKWNAVAGPPMSNYFVINSGAYNARFSQNNDGRSVQEQLGVSGSVLEEYRILIAARKNNIALRRGSYHAVPNSSTRIFSFLRHSAGQQTLLAAINLYSQQVTANLNLSATTIPGGSTTPTNIIGGGTLPAITEANKAAYSLTLPAHSYRILSVSLTPTSAGRADIDGEDIPADFNSYGRLKATQDSPTALGDNLSELNQLYVRAEPSYLAVGITGNLQTNGTGLALLLDTQPGGQNPLSVANAGLPPGGVAQLTGTRFDAGFAPDTMLWINTANGTVYVDQFALPTAGGTTKTYRGNGTVNDGDGLLNGGANPNGMQVAMNNANAAGVTATSVAGAATATTGFEILLPYTDIGLIGGPCESLRIAAFIAQTNGTVSNQWLPGLGGVTVNLGLAPDLTTIPSDQFAPHTANIPGDFNADGNLNPVDFIGFLNAFADNSPRANCDGSSIAPILTANDFQCFLNQFAQGCP